MKIVSTRFPRVRKFPIGWEAPEWITVRVRRENCQSKKTRDCLLDKAIKVLRYTTEWYDRSSDPGGHFNLVQWDYVLLCGCSLKEKLDCSNGIHKGTIWHQVCISRSGDRQNTCRIVEMKIREIFFAQKERDGLHCRWRAYHQSLDRIDEI